MPLDPEYPISPTPWTYLSAGRIILSANGDELGAFRSTAGVSTRVNPVEATENCKRAIECVNALDGVGDPAAEIARLRAVEAEFNSLNAAVVCTLEAELVKQRLKVLDDNGRLAVLPKITPELLADLAESLMSGGAMTDALVEALDDELENRYGMDGYSEEDDDEDE
jgi:hypothetical protein